MRWLLAGVFLFAAVSKSLELRKFAETISEFGIVLEGTESATAIFLVVCEFVVGIGLLLDIRGTLTAVLSLLLTFLAVLSYGLFLGLDIDCGCFGVDVVRFTTGLQDALWKDIVFLTIVVGIYFLREKLEITPKPFSILFSGDTDNTKKTTNLGD